MDVLLHSLSVGEYKTHTTKKYICMAMLGLKPTYLVSEQYRYPTLTDSAMPATGKNTSIASSIPGSRAS